MDTIEKRRAAWIAALRSRVYRQGRQWLRRGDRYCCLGVACVVVLGDAPENEARAPDAVVDALGLLSPTGSAHDNHDCLVHLNDAGASFGEIAKALETGLYWRERTGTNTQTARSTVERQTRP